MGHLKLLISEYKSLSPAILSYCLDPYSCVEANSLLLVTRTIAFYFLYRWTWGEVGPPTEQDGKRWQNNQCYHLIGFRVSLVSAYKFEKKWRQLFDVYQRFKRHEINKLPAEENLSLTPFTYTQTFFHNNSRYDADTF